MQEDIDYLLREKFEAEFKFNQLYQIVLEIDKRSKVCLNKVVESSTELTQIMRLTSRLKSLDNSKSDVSLTPKTRKSSIYKQIVTPHAVNGHIIHSPTVRIARCSAPKLSEGYTPNDKQEPECSNENVETDVKKRWEIEEEMRENEDQSNDEDPDEETSENNMDSEEESLNKENEGLPTISEEDEHEGQSGFADTFQERKSIGSPVPSVITQRKSSQTRSRSNKSSLASTSGVSCNSTLTTRYSGGLDEFLDDSHEKTVINRKSRNSMRDAESERDINVSRISSGELTEMADTLGTMNSFIEETSVHSTPFTATNELSSILSNGQTTPMKSKVTTRRNVLNRPRTQPVVRLSRIKISEEESENLPINSSKRSRIFRESNGNDEQDIVRSKKKMGSSDSRKRKTLKRSDISSPRISAVKLENIENPSGEICGMRSPKKRRAARPACLKEPSIVKKLRRSR
ncbi:hypothetical protein HHI36_015621 [Cryptolaemus montrouzieri]|uniref:Shugoshin C-terminal domain-containing protein n=1 Tax=Cryptolaemus montrouzieri TaxID=559131 RepID=A0ABD2N6K8_9CUCU